MKIFYLIIISVVCSISLQAQQINNFKYRWTSPQVFDTLAIPKICGEAPAYTGRGAQIFFDSCNNFLYVNGEVITAAGVGGPGGTCLRDIVVDTSFFIDAVTANDTSIKGTIYAIYWDDVPAFIYEGTDYEVETNGFTILTDDFDATANAYNFHVYTVDTSGGCSGSGGGGSGGIDNITDLIEAGTNVTLTGEGTADDPYVISASGSGGSTDTTSLSTRINRLNLRWTIQTLTPANTVTMNLNSGYNATLLLNRATTVIAFSNISSSDAGWIDVTQDNTGGRFVTLPAGSVVPNGFGSGTSITLSTTPNVTDRIYYSKVGSTYRWTIAKHFQ